MQRKNIGLRLPAEMLDRTDALTARQNRTRTEVMLLLESALDHGAGSAAPGQLGEGEGKTICHAIASSNLPDRFNRFACLSNSTALIT